MRMHDGEVKIRGSGDAQGRLAGKLHCFAFRELVGMAQLFEKWLR